MVALSLMVGYEVQNVQGRFKKTAVCILSNESSHGWYSAVPSYKRYIQVKKEEYQSRNISLHTHCFYSDRGPSDFWTGPFLVYSTDICKEADVNLNINTTGAGHGKHVHDTLIGTAKRKICYGFKEGLIYIVPGQSIAMRACNWLKSQMNRTDLKCRWQCIEVPETEIRVANSPTKRILTDDKKGITDYHSMYADTKGNIKFKKYSCSCDTCISSNFARCSEQIHCGEWVNYEMDEHPNYESIPLRSNSRKRRRVSEE